MRVTQSEIYNNFLSGIEQANETLNTVSREVSSGKKVSQLADSPSASAELVGISERESELDQYTFNTQAATTTLQSADSALTEVSNLLTSIYSAGSEAASSSTGAGTSATLAEQVRSLRDEILTLANTQSEGRYIFGGSSVSSAAFTISGDTVSYQGNTQPNSFTVDDGTAVQDDVTGSSAFNSAFSAIQSLLAGLDANDSTAIQSALSQFSGAMASLNQVRGQVGDSLSLLTNVQSDIQSKTTAEETEQSQLQDADMAQATVELNSAQTAVEAAVTAAGQVLSEKNLFDILG